MKTLFAAAALALTGASGLAAPALAADPIYTGRFSNTAVGGYDAVSFFDGAPQRGDSDFTTEWMGAEFRFASQNTLDRFLENPSAYAPQYGGYCAWAMAQGYTAKGDPRHWRIVDGKLYLNFNARIQSQWEADIPGFIEAADRNFPTVIAD
jgi:YHS domain-containing protein